MSSDIRERSKTYFLMAYHSLFLPGRPARRVSEYIKGAWFWSNGGHARCDALQRDATMASHLPCRVNGPCAIHKGMRVRDTPDWGD
jgi:hypothetical protein